MKRIVTDERVAAYVVARNSIAISPPYTALGIEKDGRIIGGVVFNMYTGIDVHVTVAGETGAFTRAFIRRVSHYVFQELGCLRMSITTEQPKVVELATRLLAQTEGRIRNHFGPGRDGILLGILKEDWKV